MRELLDISNHDSVKMGRIFVYEFAAPHSNSCTPRDRLMRRLSEHWLTKRFTPFHWRWDGCSCHQKICVGRIVLEENAALDMEYWPNKYMAEHPECLALNEQWVGRLVVDTPGSREESNVEC